MLENTIENKANFLKQYMFSYNCFEGIGNSLWYLVPSAVFGAQIHLGDRGLISVSDAPPLELTPLSQITDEDAIEVARIWGTKTESRIIGHSIISRIASMDSNILTEPRNMIGVIDYLRSKSYLIPYNGTPTEILIEYGWAVIKN